MRTSVDVHNFLLELDVAHELVPVQGRLRDPERLAAILGVPEGQVGRVVLFAGEGDETVAVVVPAGLEPDSSRVAGALGTGELERIPPEKATDLTGFLPEAMPPAGLPPGTRVVLDGSLADEEVLYFPGGEANAVLKIRSADLVRAVDATVAPVAG